MTDKQYTEIKKVVNGQKYSHDWNFWARLSRAGVVNVHGDGRVESVTLTEWGKVLFESESEERGER